MIPYGKLNVLNLAPGFVFGGNGEYAVLRRIGSGWEGEVFLVADTGCNKDQRKRGDHLRVVKFLRLDGEGKPVKPQPYGFQAPTWTWKGREGKAHELFLTGNHAFRVYQMTIAEHRDPYFEWRRTAKGIISHRLGRIAALSEIAARDIHLKIIGVEDWGVALLPVLGHIAPHWYEVMPFVEAPNLYDRLNGLQGKELLESAAIDWIEFVTGQIDTAMSHGYCFGPDLNCENVLYDGSGHSIIDVDVWRIGTPRIEHYRHVIEEAIRLTLLIAQWDVLGKSVLPHQDDEVPMPWMDDTKALWMLADIPELKAAIEAFIKELGEGAWPEELS